MNTKKIGIVIQARLGSTRLPNKILLPINNQPVFQIQINRLKKINIPLYIATTVQPNDIEIVNFANTNLLPSFRGSENNVLERYYLSAKQFQLDVIVRVTSDCPLIDEQLLKEGIETYLKANDPKLYLSNTIERTYPRGFDFEIFSFALLEEAFQNAKEEMDTEHVTPFIWKNKSGNVIIKQIKDKYFDKSSYRITLDTQEDFVLIKKLIEEFGADRLSGKEIIEVMDAHPELPKINEHIEQKKV